MRVAPRRSGARPLANQRRVIGPWSPEVGSAGILSKVAVASQAWAAANDPVAIAFRLNERVVVSRLGWINGTSVGTNFDIGLYTNSWVRIVSAGSTARSGTSAWQWADITDTALDPGDYYIAGSCDNTTANQHFLTAVANPQGLALMDVWDSATDAFPLPDPLTNMALATVATRVPVLAMECTSLFAPATRVFQRLPRSWIPETLYAIPGNTVLGSLHINTLANQAIYCPVTFPVSATIYSMSFAATNGTGNYDIGVYDASFRRYASSGSTAMTAAGIKTLTFPDLHVEAGTTLYAAGVWSSTGARYTGASLSSLLHVIMTGSAEEASALPLPATATPVTPANATHTPLFAFGVR